MEALDLNQLQKRVARELDQYVYKHHPRALGRPLRAEYIQKLLDDMREALVSPYWLEVEIRDTREQWEMKNALRQQVVVVADNKDNYLLTFNPDANEFMLVYRNEGRYGIINIRGDAVGCFKSI
jgi:hypothetical protein